MYIKDLSEIQIGRFYLRDLTIIESNNPIHLYYIDKVVEMEIGSDGYIMDIYQVLIYSSSLRFIRRESFQAPIMKRIVKEQQISNIELSNKDMAKAFLGVNDNI